MQLDQIKQLKTNSFVGLVNGKTTQKAVERGMMEIVKRDVLRIIGSADIYLRYPEPHILQVSRRNTVG